MKTVDKKTKKAASPKGSAKTSTAKKCSPKAKPAAQEVKPREEATKKSPNRVSPRVVPRKPTPRAADKEATREEEAENSLKTIQFAVSIAEEMKRSARAQEVENQTNPIHLTRRPTTRSQGKVTEKFPEADLQEFRKRLLEAREKALQGVDAMKATGFDESGDHEADGGDGTNQTLRLQALGHMGNINRTIQQIEEALHRIDDGTYGVCTVCGQLIRKPRLMNQPFVLTCMECQCEMERTNR